MTNTVNSKKKKKNSGYNLFKKIVGINVMTVFHLRKIIMAIPVVYYALRIAAYNSDHLPSEVGLFLQNNGDFLRMIDKGTAVTIPIFITLGCLMLMMFSRKAMYAWAISIFTLALPLLILISNVYPA